jgi:hypothetical protein
MATTRITLDKENIDRLPTLLCSLQRYYPNITIFEMAESARSPFCYVLRHVLFIKFT